MLPFISYLIRRKFEKRIATSGLSVDALVEDYTALTTLVRPAPLSGIAPDPDDDVAIGTAMAAQAKPNVTGDKPLLGVIHYQGGRIIQVSEAIKTMFTEDILWRQAYPWKTASRCR